MKPAPIIAGRDLYFARGESFELRLEQFIVQPGERLALIGPSGSGKSTLIDLIAGIQLPSGGSLEVLGEDWMRMSEERRRHRRRSQIGMAFQEFELLDYLSARENILLAQWVGGTSDTPKTLAARAEELAEVAGIRGVLARPPSQLSQGERQRVALCRALLTRPPLILCDEPTGNLDPRSTEAVLQLLWEQAARDGATVIMATHDHSLLDRFDRVVDLAARRPPGVEGPVR